MRSQRREVRRAWAGGVVAGGLAASAGLVLVGWGVAGAQPEAAPVQQQQPMDPAAMAELAEKASTPGPEHGLLSKFVGTWDATVEFTIAPGAPNATSKGVLVVEPILGGRFVRSHFSSPNLMGLEFEGFGVLGFDRVHGRYVSSWVDSMSTWIGQGFGGANAEGTQITIDKEFDWPNGPTQRSRERWTIVDERTFTLEFIEVSAEGAETSTGVITHIRREKQP